MGILLMDALVPTLPPCNSFIYGIFISNLSVMSASFDTQFCFLLAPLKTLAFNSFKTVGNAGLGPTRT